MCCRSLQALILLLALSFPSHHLAAQTGSSGGADNQSKWIISSGSVPHLPAGSMLSLALALERGAEAIWLDLVLSKDDQIVLLSDTRIDQLTDVTEIYPERSRPDGNYYSFDFTLEELRGLSLQSTGESDSFNGAPLFKSHLSVTSLDDFLAYMELVSGDLSSPPTLICTLKHGWRHKQENKELGMVVVKALENYLAGSGAASLMIGSYDPEELQQIAQSVASDHSEDISFIQLIASDEGKEVQRLEFGTYQPYSYDLLFTRFGLKSVSTYAHSIGLDPEAVMDETGALSQPRFLDDARALGLQVVCNRVDSLPSELALTGSGPEAMFEYLLFTIGFDGIVTSNDLIARQWLGTRATAGGDRQNEIIERLIDRVEESGSEPPARLQSDTTM